MLPGKIVRFSFLLLFAIFVGGFGVVSVNASVAPPIVQAQFVGSLLRIEAQDGFYPTEAVFVNGRRFNFRVDSALMVDVSRYIAGGESIEVYATDFQGNASLPLFLTPPTATATLPNNLTPDGQGEVLDHATSERDDVEFITISTPAGNVFHLIIDHTRSSNNVYFLNAVTEWDLVTLAEGAELPVPPQFAVPPPPPPEPQPESVTADPEPESGGRAGMVIFMVVAGLVAFAVAYYLKVYSKKNKGQPGEDYDEDADDDGEDSDGDESDGEGWEDAEGVEAGQFGFVQDGEPGYYDDGSGPNPIPEQTYPDPAPEQTDGGGKENG